MPTDPRVRVTMTAGRPSPPTTEPHLGSEWVTAILDAADPPNSTSIRALATMLALDDDCPAALRELARRHLDKPAYRNRS